jgi:hypothetical protein
MEMHSIYLFVHIMLLVFWLGTDVGVFLAAKVSERSDLGTEARVSVLQLGMVLDRLPRTCLTLIFPSGLLLASSSGYVVISDLWMIGVWLVSLVWLAFLWAGFLNPGTPLEERGHKVNGVMNVLLAVGLCALAASSLVWSTPQMPLWLTLKVLLVGLLGVCGVALDMAFLPAATRFQKIAGGDDSDETQAGYGADLVPVYRWVLTIYGLVALAALLGVTKAL